MLTLTLRAADSPLTDQIDRLYACFRKMRASALWKETVKAGVAVCEITQNADTLRWHPHLHCLVRGSWIPQDRLAREWLRVTGDSSIVHVSFVRTAEHAANYVTKYLTKPAPAALYHCPQTLDELITALRGRRQILSFGEWRNARLTRELTEEGWRSVGHMNELLYGSRTNDPKMQLLLDWLRENWRRAVTSASFVVDPIADAIGPPPPSLPPLATLTREHQENDAVFG